MWRRRVLLKKGARIHVASLERGDDFALSVLDPSGVVVCWYGRNGEKEMATSPIVERHVSQFYLARDVVSNRVGLDLRKATTVGRSTRNGWRLRANREAFWAVTDIEAMTRRDGRLQGFVHMVRARRDPFELLRSIPPTLRTKPRTYGAPRIPAFAFALESLR
ncbi:MAG: hypothetical protein ABW110_12980 [Steroidobacteraceae bacterium]